MGLKVALLEKNAWLGGYSHGFSKDGFYWDHGGHIFLAYRLDGQARQVFQEMGLDKRVEMVPDKHDYRCIFPDESLSITADISEAADVFAARFPEERDGITKVLLIMESLIEEVDMYVPSFHVQQKPGQRRLLDPIKEQFQRPRLSSSVAPLLRATKIPGGNLTKYQTWTLKQLLDEHLKSPRLKAYFSMLSAGIGANPANLSAVIAGVFFIHALRTQWMPQGGFNTLGVALAEMVQEQGGEVFTNAKVTRITTDAGRGHGRRDGGWPSVQCQGGRLSLRRADDLSVDAASRCRSGAAAPAPAEDGPLAVDLPGASRCRYGPRAVSPGHQATQLHLPVRRYRQGDGAVPGWQC